MVINIRWIAAIALLAASHAMAAERLELLDARNRESVAQPGGEDYEVAAALVLLDEGEVLKACVPSGGPKPEAISIYFHIAADGAMDELVMVPQNGITGCIESLVSDKSFAPNKSGFLAKISLAFKN